MGEVGWVEGALGCELVVDRKGGEREMGWTARGAQIGLAPRFSDPIGAPLPHSSSFDLTQAQSN